MEPTALSVKSRQTEACEANRLEADSILTIPNKKDSYEECSSLRFLDKLRKKKTKPEKKEIAPQQKLEPSPENIELPPVQTWLGPFASNDSRQVAFLYSEIDPSKPVHQVIYLPGFNITGNGTIKGMLESGFDQALAHIPPNTVYVLVEGPPIPDANLYHAWLTQKGSFSRLMKDINGQIESIAGGPIESTTNFLVHSGGGRIIRDAANHQELPPDTKQIVFLDASYGSWASETAQLISSNIFLNLFYIPGAPTTPDALFLKGANKDNVTVTAFPSSTHMSLPVDYLNSLII